MKVRKSRSIKLALLGTTALFILAACDSPPEEMVQFNDRAECVFYQESKGEATLSAEQICEQTYNEALARHKNEMATFKTEEDCIADTTTNCQMVTRDGQSMFVPFMAGWMMSNMMDGGGRYYSTPMYRSTTGKIFSTRGSLSNTKIVNTKGTTISSKSFTRAGFGSTGRAMSTGGRSRSSGS